jgi:predicted acetyltransferase
MTIEIRPVPAKDLRGWFEAVNTAFGEDVTDEQWALDQKITEPDRVLGVYDGDRVVGGGAIFTFRMTVPGGRKADVAGVTMVGVMPTHRRQGALRGLMARQLADVRAAGEPIAALWASEGSIYQRFGYGLATLNGAMDIERDRAAFRQPVEPSGQIELRDVASARPAIKKVYDAVQAITPGFCERHPDWWDVRLSDATFRRGGAGRLFSAVLVRDGEEVGYVLYRIKGDWLPTGPANALMIVELIGLDSAAQQELWRYVFGVDLMHNIRSRLGPADHPLLLMVAEPRRLQLRVGDGMWLRLVDVPKALRARGYSADGSIVLDITD